MYFQRLCFGRAVFWYILLFPLNWGARRGSSRYFSANTTSCLMRIFNKAPDSTEGMSTLTKDKQSLEAMYRKGWQDAEKLVQWYRAAKAEA